MDNSLSQRGSEANAVVDVGKNNSVASVSFSYDNSKLMMVGDDGVIVIRNLNYLNL